MQNQDQVVRGTRLKVEVDVTYFGPYILYCMRTSAKRHRLVFCVVEAMKNEAETTENLRFASDLFFANITPSQFSSTNDHVHHHPHLPSLPAEPQYYHQSSTN